MSTIMRRKINKIQAIKCSCFFKGCSESGQVSRGWLCWCVHSWITSCCVLVFTEARLITASSPWKCPALGWETATDLPALPINTCGNNVPQSLHISRLWSTPRLHLSRSQCLWCNPPLVSTLQTGSIQTFQAALWSSRLNPLNPAPPKLIPSSWKSPGSVWCLSCRAHTFSHQMVPLEVIHGGHRVHVESLPICGGLPLLNQHFFPPKKDVLSLLPGFHQIASAQCQFPLFHSKIIQNWKKDDSFIFESIGKCINVYF